MGVVAFVHAHPDDEAIFTGGTMRLLADAGHRVELIVATGGELGLPTSSDEVALEVRRRTETDEAACLLGVRDVHHLGYHDSGMAGEATNHLPGAFWAANIGAATARLAGLLHAVAADAVVVYDEFGIYGHPDHIQVHRVGLAAAADAGIGTVYAATIDREHLHFVETHLVEEAILAGDLGLVRSHIGVATVEITTTIDVGSVLDIKRAAMAAHASQIPETTSALQLPVERFAAVYGYEWYVRSGPPGPLDDLS